MSHCGSTQGVGRAWASAAAVACRVGRWVGGVRAAEKHSGEQAEIPHCDHERRCNQFVSKQRSRIGSHWMQMPRSPCPGEGAGTAG